MYGMQRPDESCDVGVSDTVSPCAWCRGRSRRCCAPSPSSPRARQSENLRGVYLPHDLTTLGGDPRSEQ